MGRALAGRRFALVLTSPLERARERAGSREYSDEAEIEPNLQEWDYGDYEGRTTSEIQKENPGWSIWDGAPLHGETIGQVAARAEAVIARVLSVEGDAALFAHGHLLRRSLLRDGWG